MEQKKQHDIEAILNEQKVAIDKVIEQWLPRTFDKSSVERMCGVARYAYDVEGVTEAIAKPMWDILDRGGKRWRPVLLFLIAEALGGAEAVQAVRDMVVICEVVHNGTLVVDDIEDDSKVRRGKECVHLLYGVDIAVNAGNAMYYLPTTVFKEMRGKVEDSKLLHAYELYCQEMSNLHIGQGLDIWWHRGGGTPTGDQYLQMCAYKTGTLARLSAKLSALFSGGSQEQIEAVGQFAEAVGVGFQVQDDILNLVGETLAATKGGYGEDIHEGKRTLMVLHCLEVAPAQDAARLKAILAEHPTDQAVIDEAIAIIKRTGSIEYAAERAKKLVLDAWKQVETTLPASEAKEKLHAFAHFLVDRTI